VKPDETGPMDAPARTCQVVAVAFGVACSLPDGHPGDHQTDRGSVRVRWPRQEILRPEETR
jgi:hypothetical protein